MRFSHLVLQGVRNFVKMHRLTLGKGFLVFVGGSGSGKSTVVDLILHLLYPDSIEPATDKFKGANPSVCRAALDIDDDTGRHYRLVQDLVSGAIVMSQLDPSSSRFVPVSSAASEILQYLGSQLHLPHQDVYLGVYLTRDDCLPSRLLAHPAALESEPRPAHGNLPRASRRIGAAAAGAVMGSAGAAAARRLPPSAHLLSEGEALQEQELSGYQGLDPGEQLLPNEPEEIRAQIETLEQNLATSKQVDNLQFELDGLQSELFQVTDKLKEVKETAARMEQIGQDLKQFEKLSRLPEDFEQRIRNFGKGQEKLNRDMARLDKEQQKLEKQAQQAAPEPLLKQPAFLMGMLLGLGALAAGVAGFFLSEPFHEPLRYSALLDILGFGIAVVMAIRYLNQQMGAKYSRARLDQLEERRQKTLRQFELENTIIRKTMQEMGANSPHEVIERYDQRNQVLSEQRQAKERLEAKQKDPQFAEAETRRQKLQERIGEIEAKLVDASGLMMDPVEMERKVERLREKLARIEVEEMARKTGQVWTGQPALPGERTDDLGMGELAQSAFARQPPNEKPPPPVEAEIRQDTCQNMLKLSEDLFLVDRERIEQMVVGEASRYVAALTIQAYPQLVFGPGGFIQCIDASTGGSVALSRLPAAIQDLVYLGLKFAIVETFSRQQPIPLLLDDPFKRITPDLHDLLGRMLAGLGKSTQVILFTDQTTLAQHATASFKL